MLAAALALVPSESRAGCDLPWVHRTDRSGSVNDLAIFHTGETRSDLASSVPDRREPRSPCAGGACSRSPELPINTSDSTPGRVELWGALSADSRPPATPSDGIVVFPDRPRPARIPVPIERPPRMAAPRPSVL